MMTMMLQIMLHRQSNIYYYYFNFMCEYQSMFIYCFKFLFFSIQIAMPRLFNGNRITVVKFTDTDPTHISSEVLFRNTFMVSFSSFNIQHAIFHFYKRGQVLFHKNVLLKQMLCVDMFYACLPISGVVVMILQVLFNRIQEGSKKNLRYFFCQYTVENKKQLM